MTRSLRDAFDVLNHLYAAASAHIRQDQFAISYLRGTEGNRRQLLHAAVSVTAQALDHAGDRFDPDLLSCLTSDYARAELLDAAMAHTVGDRLTGYETVERLARVQRSVTDIAGPLIAQIWALAAFSKGESPEQFSSRLCLAVGMVGSALDD